MYSTWKMLSSKIHSRISPRLFTHNLNNEKGWFKLNLYRAFNRNLTVHIAILSTIFAYHSYHTRTQFLVVVAMSEDSLCFREAYDARLSGRIELEESLIHTVAHYGGLRHQTDAEGQRPYIPAGFENEVRKLVLSQNFQPLDEDNTAIINSIFLSGFQGDVAAVRKLIDSSSISSEHYLRPLMRISTAEGDPQLLRVCFENGFLGTGYLDSELLLGSRVRNNPSTAWLDVLFDFDLHQWRTNPQQLCKWRTWHHLLFMGADCTRWWIEHGGSASRARGLFEHTTGWPGAPTIRVLLDEFGVDWFIDSGTLQLAVQNHDFETVKMLVEAGADVNEYPTDWQMDVREYRAAPLSALHEAMYAKSEKMIRYLAEHGAKLTLEDLHIPDTYNTLPKEYRVFADLVVELGAVKEATSL
ncbi:uncharacterized protein K460DRAFT_396379 [Cucurbitaria berberidis CBS 394.84]|uniref:Ankyrin n=1 Tax=Cucurbitaria berberidis CBS 394.84 TaxID=1168544 RepID=A0A9P4L6D6_9PLEO|nr:uncharacterized protein K460DRAFT_396379 [Cucurbitaria berberidis CBS 394.84]KAF1842948.1 hypothetical protein K460DRAFT_396379 [Cucurbitaria berberidis CBS 394.84]